jgi:hypothetical protein
MSVCLTFSFDSQQEGVVDRFAQGHGGLNVFPEKCHDYLVGDNAAVVVRQASKGSEGDAYDAVVIVKDRNIIEKDNWGISGVANWWKIGGVGNDGVSRWFDEGLARRGCSGTCGKVFDR